MPLIIALILAFPAGYGLQRLISGGVGLPNKPTDYGRIWSGWVVWGATLYLLTGALMQLDIESFILWVMMTLVYGGAAFGAGCAYGAVLGKKSSQIDDGLLGVPVEDSDLMTLPDDALQEMGTQEKVPASQPKSQLDRPNPSPRSQGIIEPKATSQKDTDMAASPMKRVTPALEKEAEGQFYEKVWAEIEDNEIRKALWARLFSECDGDIDKTKARYISQRVAELIQQAENRKRKEKEAAR